MIRITLHPPRCQIGRFRLHHGLIGVLLIVYDRRDVRVWFRDLIGRR